MRDILKAEALRYRLWILLAATGHLLLLAFFMRLADPGQQPLNTYRLIGGCYALVGILLGLHQFGTWRRPNQWLNLLHRPLTPTRIAAGVLGAGAFALIAAIAAPALIALAWQAWGTPRVVDPRHLIMPISALLIALAGYLAGAYGVLADRRYSSCGLVLLLWIAGAQATGPASLIIEIAACLWLLGMVCTAFRPELGAPPRTLVAMLLTALPVQMGAYLLLLVLGFIGQFVWIMQGSHPINMRTPPAGGYVETDRMSGRDRMLAGLKSATLDEVPLWREQVALSEVYDIGRQIGGFPQRESMSNAVPMEFEDAEARIRWTFSHTRMRYEGVNVADGTRVGELGLGTDNAAFPAIPTPDGTLPGIGKGDTSILAGDTLYQYMSASRRIVPRLRATAGEVLLGTVPVGGSLAAISDKAVYVFDGRHLIDSALPVTPRQRIVIPGAPGDLSRAELVELVDGYLLSFTFTRQAYDLSGAAPHETLLWANDEGSVTLVATRNLGADFPTFYRYQAWWLSPVSYTLNQAAVGLFGHVTPYRTYATPPVPASMWMLAALVLAVSAVAAAWLVVRREMAWVERIAWVLVCALVGLPALVSLALLVPRDLQVRVSTLQHANA